MSSTRLDPSSIPFVTRSQLLDFVGDQLASAGRGAQNLANQFPALVNANGPQGPYVSPDDLSGPGGNSKPPAAGGSAVPVAVCVPPVCTVVPAVTLGTPGYGPGNATLNSGGNDSVSGNGNGNGSSAYDRVYGGRTSIENVTSRGTSIETVPNSNDATAASDFSALKPNNVKTVSTGRGDVSIGTLDDGSTVILRPSKDGRTTIEFQNANGRTTKEIRYGSK